MENVAINPNLLRLIAELEEELEQTRDSMLKVLLRNQELGFTNSAEDMEAYLQVCDLLVAAQNIVWANEDL